MAAIQQTAAPEAVDLGAIAPRHSDLLSAGPARSAAGVAPWPAFRFANFFPITTCDAVDCPSLAWTVLEWPPDTHEPVMLSRTILIADDDRLLRESLSDVLTGMGCRTWQAGDGQGAIRILSQDRCDLLLSDVDMPDMTGFQLLDWVRGHPPAPATVLMSARADQRLDAEARAGGAMALLPKPVAISALTALVSSLFPR